MKKNLFVGSPTMKFIWESEETATLYSIANSIYLLENIIKKGGQFPDVVLVDIYKKIEPSTQIEITKLLNILVEDVLCEEINFELVPKKLPKTKTQKIVFKPCDTICLYSGGVDSSIGILKSKEEYGDVRALYVAHKYTGRIDGKVEYLNKVVLKPKKIILHKFIAPEWLKDYSQTRGFLYFLYGGILAHLIKSKRLIISECGQTMYQPKFAPLDTITYTTHPYVLEIAKTILGLILKKDIDIITMFEDFTKSELINLMPDDKLLSNTHSCVTGRWKDNCGTCYACLTRILGSINNKLSIFYFRKNPFLIPDNEDLNALINFCFKYLYDKEDIDFWSFRSIEHFKKNDLFNRVADEVFLALFILKKQGILHPNYEFVLDEYLAKDAKRLDIRRKQLEQIKEPDFKKIVKNYVL
ncbi:MAG: hypothetical protein ABIE94_03325 [archaeon]